MKQPFSKEGESAESKYKYTELTLGGGVMHMLSNEVALDARVTYAMQTSGYGDNPKVKGNVLSLSLGFSAFTY